MAKRDFYPEKIGRGAKRELIEIEINEKTISFLVLRELLDGRTVYNKAVIDKQEIMDFFQDELYG